MKEPCGMEEERDPRFRRLSIFGAALNFVAVVFAFTAAATNHWADLGVHAFEDQPTKHFGPIQGYMGLFIVCQDIPGGLDRCENGGLGPYRQTFASYVAGALAILCAVGLGMGLILAPLVIAMHHAQHEICLKFRHVIFARLVVISAAAVFSLIACICFILEAKIFVKMQSDESTETSWSFYLEVAAFVVSIVVSLTASYEWRWSRKLGGDPTVYSRDPEGVKADTIVNPNFRDAPRTGTPSTGDPDGRHLKVGRGASRSGEIHRNVNGVAMTTTSGLPYSLTANAGLRVTNGHIANGQPRLAFDPKKTPLRSSLRRPKPSGTTGGEDSPDNPTVGVVQNPTFANTSPTPKKKVRIHTQSTAV